MELILIFCCILYKIKLPLNGKSVGWKFTIAIHVEHIWINQKHLHFSNCSALTLIHLAQSLPIVCHICGQQKTLDMQLFIINDKLDVASTLITVAKKEQKSRCSARSGIRISCMLQGPRVQFWGLLWLEVSAKLNANIAAAIGKTSICKQNKTRNVRPFM